MSKRNETDRILIVDDNPLNLKMLDIILRNENYKTFKAENGFKAMELAKNEMPDLIFLDIMMPEIDGYEVCRKLKSDPKTEEIPIIFLTSKTDTEGIVKGFELGAADYVTRPFNRVELLARLRTHLALKKSRDRVIELERRNSILAMITTTNHEINQPLTVLKGNLFLLKESLPADKLTPDQKKYFKKLETAIERIQDILIKYRNAEKIRFEQYSSDTQMVVFEEQDESDGQPKT